MGKTPKPLSILVSKSLLPWEELDKMAAQGHTIVVMGHDLCPACRDATDEYDMILSGKAWRMLPALKKLLPMAVKAAREERYAKAKVPRESTRKRKSSGKS